MNIKNYLKHFTDWTVETSFNAKDEYGGMEVGVDTRAIKGYFSKSMTTTRDTGEGIHETRSGGILFTKPNVHLVNGDILNRQYQVIDFNKFKSHNEYSVKYLDKWGDSSTPELVYDILTEDGAQLLTESDAVLLTEGE